MLEALVFVFGLAVGSFLNVCIRRIPAEVSIVWLASRCPACETPIKPYDNIPVLSYIVLGGRCRTCKTRISPVYPVVELLTASLFLLCILEFGATVEGLKWTVFSALIVVLVFTDIFERILPDVVNFAGLGMGLAFSMFTQPMDASAMWLSRALGAMLPVPVLSVATAILGTLVGGGTLYLVPKVYYWWKGVMASLREGQFSLRGLPWERGMGLGDIKMMVMVGTFLGPMRTFLTILFGSLLGSLLGALTNLALFVTGYKRGVAARAERRELGNLTRLRWALACRYQLPFGTFLGAGAVFVVFLGTTILEWYAEFFR